jgi:hypothetical protein
MAWCPIKKGVSNVYRYCEVCQAANLRYLEALSVVEDPAPAYRQMEELTEPVVSSSRSHAASDPASWADIKLFGAVLNGDQLLHGFRNADIREALFGFTDDDLERCRQSTTVGRMLKRLHVRVLIAKVPRSRRWHETEKGHQLLGAVVRLCNHGIPAARRRIA